MNKVEKVVVNENGGTIFTVDGELIHWNTISGLHVTDPWEIEYVRLTPDMNHWSIVNLVKNGSHNCNIGESRFVFRNKEGQWKLAPVVGKTDWGYQPDRGTYQVWHEGDIILGCNFGNGSPGDWRNTPPPLSYGMVEDKLVKKDRINYEDLKIVDQCLLSLTKDQAIDLMVHQGRRGIWLER